MTPYRSITGKSSGVTAYDIGEDHILVRFYNTIYKYSYKSCGRKTVTQMKKLAMANKGLSTFISQHDPAYEWKR
jgi:hypothetical protein